VAGREVGESIPKDRKKGKVDGEAGSVYLQTLDLETMELLMI
jgi:hypothetical protein